MKEMSTRVRISFSHMVLHWFVVNQVFYDLSSNTESEFGIIATRSGFEFLDSRVEREGEFERIAK